MISAPSAAFGLVHRWTDHTLNRTGEARAERVARRAWTGLRIVNELAQGQGGASMSFVKDMVPSLVVFGLVMR
ncbi:hypothetical protein [Streptomyces sp. NPDC002164]|uniref:hypothetical protein n=1 Tax=Streptomyces sp. NPDC002164 TaxID=3364633 RepID=UPI0036B87EDD